MIYRREIDGLRALAVIPVILFHAGFSALSGGYVGVDIFFVISGYLITTIILDDLRRGNFSISRFYERRARRILPALFLVIGVTLIFSWQFLLPSDMEELARSISYVPVFLTNLFFYRESGYFDTAAELKPLLHTWSLAVEEQYYVFFPILLLALYKKFPRSIPFVLVAFAFVSLIYAEFQLASDPAAAFFLMPSRIWELLVGAVVAYCVFRSGTLLKSEFGAISGLVMIILSLGLYDSTTRFPGIAAVLPVLGTALIVLCATSETFVGRLLGMRALVAVGLVSYSAYLWHQPIFALARHRSFSPPSAEIFVWLTVLVFLLAYFSWRFVEQPFRRAGAVGTKALIASAAASAAFLVAFSIGGRVSDGYDHRMEHKVGLANITERMRRNYGLGRDCDGPDQALQNCSTAGAPEVLLWGDSYAMHLAEGLRSSKADIRLAQFSQSACGPILSLAPILDGRPLSWGERCIRNNAGVLELIRKTPSIKYVVLSSRFDQYFNDRNGVLLPDLSVSKDLGIIARALSATLQTLRELGVTPVIFSPTPGIDRDLGRCVTRALFLGGSVDACSFNLSEQGGARNDVMRMLRQIESEVTVVWLSDGLCVNERCQTLVGDVIVFRDEGHLSYEGSAYLGGAMRFYDRIVSAN